MQPELKQQVPLMKELLKAMNITVVEQEGYEADDILGTIAKESAAKGIDVSIVSGDRDLLQLADEHIKIRIPKTKKGVTEVEDYYPSDVFEHLEELKPPKAKTSITENVEQIKMSRFLSEIKIDVPIDYKVEDSKAGDFFNENSYELFKKYNFKNMLKKLKIQI